MRYTLTRFGLAAVLAGGLASPAHAFYWLGWPGANVHNPPPIVSQTEVIEHHQPPKTWEPPPDEQPPEEEPPGTPEPATMAIAGIGLGVLGVRWWKKRKKK